jgi:uncharacterized protein with PQ loop repeat
MARRDRRHADHGVVHSAGAEDHPCRDTRGISLWMYVAFTVGVTFWFGYGLLLHSWPMIVSNAITFVLAMTILVLKMRHG